VWGDIIWGLIPAIAVFKLLLFRERFEWPLQQYKNSYLGSGLFPVTLFLAIWIVVACFNDANPAPLPYLPIMNPLDIVQLFSILVIVEWLRQVRDGVIPSPSSLNVDFSSKVVAMIVFIWLNSLVAHSVHYYAGVRYALLPMFDSAIFQTSISIVWTLTAFIVMGIASRLGKRYLWFIGSTVLAAVVIKLFVIDLAESGTVTRIISFLSVGVLMLVIGYFSPPPEKEQTQEAE